jgi:DNA-binding NarL/FixJ family response regulator
MAVAHMGVRDGTTMTAGLNLRRGRGERLRVLVYEPIPLVAEALSLFLAMEPDIEAFGVSDLAEFMTSLAGAALVVLSVHAWGPQVLTVLQRVRELSAAPLIVLGPDNSARSLALSVGKGADAYVYERATPVAFLEAIRSVADGQAPPSGNGSSAAPAPDDTLGQAPARLTPREQEVISLVAEDLTAQQIASSLGVSERTIHSHLQHTYRKLGVHGRISAVLAAQCEGLLLSRPKLAGSEVS